ncbi:aspartate kinase [Brachybacterium halotolerans subsp. kimchii]|uniref:aspartate kinase n=1 Tax=Brachybacterium TaxID=43668 RepID=UPI001E426535|nr:MULTISPECIES: aspartate kinase [Brachybacterium]MCG7309818.1 aspartate kinase [Brachybacterium sp. ACRRE]UEJ84330.1 aspartate kinase [Brachybacterium halotolerans subsp. kimchii]
MSLVVQKFGGSSVADAASVIRVASRIAQYAKAGHEVVVVVSAMGDTTDELIDLAEQVTPNPPPRELDMLLTAGERISMAVLSMALNNSGVAARAYTGSQAGVITDEVHGKALIQKVTPGRIRSALDAGNVAIVAGFQGVSQGTKDITTLGRGGSDTTAVALAAALDADICEIYSDVDGVFTADPRIVPSARRVPVISCEEMLDLAANGAKILMGRSVEYARRYGVPLHVRSSFSGRLGTIVSDDAERMVPVDPGVTVRIADVPHLDAADPSKELSVDTTDPGLEAPIISGVAHDRSEGKITVVEVPDQPGKAALLFDVVASSGANIDMIVQNSSTTDDTVAISLTLPEADSDVALAAIERARETIGFSEVRYNNQIGKVSVVGAGMKSSPGVSATLFRSLGEAGINIDMISTSEIRISVVTDISRLDDAVRVIHTAFGLDAEQTEAVVYGGTGR